MGKAPWFPEEGEMIQSICDLTVDYSRYLFRILIGDETVNYRAGSVFKAGQKRGEAFFLLDDKNEIVRVKDFGLFRPYFGDQRDQLTRGIVSKIVKNIVVGCIIRIPENAGSSLVSSETKYGNYWNEREDPNNKDVFRQNVSTKLKFDKIDTSWEGLTKIRKNLSAVFGDGTHNQCRSEESHYGAGDADNTVVSHLFLKKEQLAVIAKHIKTLPWWEVDLDEGIRRFVVRTLDV